LTQQCFGGILWPPGKTGATLSPDPKSERTVCVRLENRFSPKLSEFTGGQVARGATDFFLIKIVDECRQVTDVVLFQSRFIASDIDRIDSQTLLPQLGDRRVHRAIAPSSRGKKVHDMPFSGLGIDQDIRLNLFPVQNRGNQNGNTETDSDSNQDGNVLHGEFSRAMTCLGKREM
jgi:hypothetical protein